MHKWHCGYLIRKDLNQIDNLSMYFKFQPENLLYEDLTDESNLKVGKKMKMSVTKKQ